MSEAAPPSGATGSSLRPLWRLTAVFVGVAIFVAVPFVVWGGEVEAAFRQDRLATLFAQYQSFAWLVAIGLLVSDLILPIPNTIVMAALGAIYGPFLGGAFATLGTCLAGLAGYALCRRFGPLVAGRLLSPTDLAAGEQLFARHGGWIVAASRWLPVLPEAISCMAGLARMPLPKFALALLCGAAPLGFIVAGLGYSGSDRPLLTLLVCALLPVPLWYVFQRATGAAGRAGPSVPAQNPDVTAPGSLSSYINHESKLCFVTPEATRSGAVRGP
ncbi:MAG: VTT domain-containing protein [Pseudomonadota bacterium]|nr:VTT domain-containing protein [Pseudomonadota bacterium]